MAIDIYSSMTKLVLHLSGRLQTELKATVEGQLEVLGWDGEPSDGHLIAKLQKQIASLQEVCPLLLKLIPFLRKRRELSFRCSTCSSKARLSLYLLHSFKLEERMLAYHCLSFYGIWFLNKNNYSTSGIFSLWHSAVLTPLSLTFGSHLEKFSSSSFVNHHGNADTVTLPLVVNCYLILTVNLTQYLRCRL